MKAKRFLALILALVMALSLVACGDSGKTPAADGDSNGGGDSSFPKMTWTAATSGAEGSNFDVGLEKFSELLQEKTNGAVKLDIYCSDQLTNGSTADSVQACMDGTIDVTFQADGIWGNFDTVFNIPNLPFLFDSYDDVDSKLINGEGGKYLMKAMEDKYNVKCLGIGENGFRYLTNRKHPVKTPDDLHDLKLRIGGAPILIATYQHTADAPTFHVPQHPLKGGALEIRAGIAVVGIAFRHYQLRMIFDIRLQQLPLVADGITLHPVSVLPGQATVQRSRQ